MADLCLLCSRWSLSARPPLCNIQKEDGTLSLIICKYKIESLGGKVKDSSCRTQLYFKITDSHLQTWGAGEVNDISHPQNESRCPFHHQFTVEMLPPRFDYCLAVKRSSVSVWYGYAIRHQHCKVKTYSNLWNFLFFLVESSGVLDCFPIGFWGVCSIACTDLTQWLTDLCLPSPVWRAKLSQSIVLKVIVSPAETSDS